jgi:hypothetical protein
MKYKEYIKNFLRSVELKAKNKYAPNGVRYCNGLCQDYCNIDDFCNKNCICNSCRNYFNLAEKLINSGKITLENFQNNPSIVYGEESKEIDIFKLCEICKENKSIIHFDSKRNKCKSCRTLESIKRVNTDIDLLISNIEKTKDNLKQLENLLFNIPTGKLTIIISHYKIGRKSSDNKQNKIFNIIEYFRKLQNPYKCQGGCEFILEEQFSTCQKCLDMKEQFKSNRRKNITEFQTNLPILMETFVGIPPNEEHLYNIHEIKSIAKFLNIDFRHIMVKQTIIDLINEHMKKRAEEDKKEVKKKDLKLNGMFISLRDDGYINTTHLCKAGDKLFSDWYKLKSTKELISILESDMNISTLLIDNKTNRDTWIHPDLAIQLAQWISPLFALQVSKWIRELAIYESVTIGKEKSNQELLKVQQELKTITKKHNNLLQKRSYYKFKQSNALYIISDNDSKVNKYKIGICNDINDRLSNYRTSIPSLKLEYLIYTKNNKLIEDAMLHKFAEFRKLYLNHEWIFELSLETIVNSIETLINFLVISHTKEENVENYNDEIKV